MANLIVCLDGTWNNPSQEDNGIPAPTNVFKLFNAADDSDSYGNEQKKFYHPGLGGEEIGKKDEYLGGAIGHGIGRHICNAYHWIARQYNPGDSVYIFGFSRGAFIARSLCGLLKHGLIDFTGVPEQQRWEQTHSLYEKYRNISRDLSAIVMRQNGAPFLIRFVGVWDTVGALGVPDDLEILNLLDKPEQWRFHNTELGAHIQTARHAMAIDEKRSSFTVTRWSNAANHNDAKEVWFPGVHSDVGGGYADTDLSDIALKWMIEESGNAGLNFRNISKQLNPNPAGVLHNSYKGLFSLLRSRPRNVPAVDEQSNGGLFHESVFERQKVSPITAPAYWPTKRIGVGEIFKVDVFARQHWNYTKVFMKRGDRYTFDSVGLWVDKNDVCDWEGTENDEFTIADVIRAGSSLFGKIEGLWNKYTDNPSTDFWGTKRVEKFKWFIAIGCISNDDQGVTAVKNDGSPHPHQYVQLPDFCDDSAPFEVEEDGYFYVFANDVWAFYGNNRGSIELQIKRLPD